ncbi:hypothetical protein QYF36_016135 [Acer negundo]|nr:hypothetical protein QYF36_016135 [Acer negundo]
MTIRTLFANLKRSTAWSWRSLSSRASPVNSVTKPSTTKDDDLGTSIFRLKFPRRSATAVIQNWVDSGHKASVSELRFISRTLLKSKRYKHAFEILTWMEKQNSLLMSAADHAIRMELIIKVHSLTEAEENMNEAIDAMKKGFAMLRHCHWRPSEDILLAIAEYFEKNGNFEDANQFIRAVHHLGLASLPLYKSLLRMHVTAQKPAFDILEMMEKDKIVMDENTSSIV